MISLFKKKNYAFLDEARKREIITKDQHKKLTQLEDELSAAKGTFNIVHSLGKLGAFIFVLGIILVISANWDTITDSVKIAGFLLLLSGVHIAALWLHENKPEYERTIHSLHFLGAALFIAGIGLIAQIYNLTSKNGEAFLIWCAFILPLAIVLRSVPITMLSMAGFFIWFNVFAQSPANPFRLYADLYSMLFINLAAIVIFMNIFILLKDRMDETMTEPLEKLFSLAVIFILYMYGFIHHSWGKWYYYQQESSSMILPWLLLILAFSSAAAVFTLGSKNLTNLRRILVYTMSITLITAFLAILVENGILDSGNRVVTRNYGDVNYHYGVFLFLAIVFWIIWFVLGFWATIYGSVRGNKTILNMGVGAIGLGVMTRFIDLVGTAMGTGMMFIASGALLLLTGFVLEKWRRNLISNMKGAARG